MKKQPEQMPEDQRFHDTYLLLKKYRDVVLLRIYAELPFSQIALALKISENSAKVIFFRAKKKMMEVLKDEFAV